MFFSIDEGLLYLAHGLLQNSNLTRVSWVKAWEDGQWDGLDLSLRHILPFDVLCQPVHKARPKERGAVPVRQGALGGSAPGGRRKSNSKASTGQIKIPKAPETLSGGPVRD